MCLHARSAALVTVLSAVSLLAQDVPRYAGPTPKGFLLPNGWTVSPVGDQVLLSDLPLNIVPTPDGRHALVATSGYNAHRLSLVDLSRRMIVASETVRESWYGLAGEPATGKIWWS